MAYLCLQFKCFWEFCNFSVVLYVASKGCVVLVDFDWAGKDGESRYPAMLNPSNMWAEEVSPYGIMHKAHDLWQLDQLIALCKIAHNSPDLVLHLLLEVR